MPSLKSGSLGTYSGQRSINLPPVFTGNFLQMIAIFLSVLKFCRLLLIFLPKSVFSSPCTNLLRYVKKIICSDRNSVYIY